MPKWIHDRARHIQAKNPGMSEQVAFAVATQQAHKLKKTPKGYGTVEGRKAARAKFDKPRKQYVKGADPKGIGKKLDAELKKQADQLLIDDRNPLVAPRKERRAWPWLLAGSIAGAAAASRETIDPRIIAQAGLLGAASMYVGSRMLSKPIDHEKTAEEQSDMSNLYEMAKLEGFSDELQKIASAPGVGRKALEAARKAGGRGKELLMGGAKKKPGLLGRIVGKESERPVKSLTGRAEAAAAKLKGDKGKLKEIRKVQATRGAAAAAAGTAGVAGVKKHRKTERRQLGRAYVTGARDMYGQMLRSQYGR